jgi:DNA-dependent protein kinase catalytic subunit
LKLSGINPCVITRNDLTTGILKDSKYLNEILNVSLGQNAVDNGLFIMLRTKLLKEKNENYKLTVEEQVKCIIEQSTDPDILGRTYAGWEPFV